MTHTVLLGDLIDVKHGYAFKGECFSDQGEMIVVTPGNFYDTGGFKYKTKEKYYTGGIPSNYVFNKNDIAIAMTEQMEGLLGSAIFIPEDNKFLHNQRIGLVTIKDPSKLDSNFLYYLFNSQNVRKQISSMATGTKIRHTSPTNIYKVKISLPTINEQKHVGSTLRRLDEKIELNRKINETLEQIGQTLFHHYFITNPDAEKWEVGKIGELTDINKESIGKDYPHDQIQYVDISSVSTGSIDKYETIALSSAPSRAKRIVRDGDIVWAMVRPNRRAYSLIMNPADDMIVSTGFAVLSPKKNTLGFVYYHTSSQSFSDYLTLHARGAAYPAVTASDFKNAPISIPDASTLEEFNKLVLPNMHMMSELKEQIQILTTLRDTLLPRLINGKVKL